MCKLDWQLGVPAEQMRCFLEFRSVFTGLLKTSNDFRTVIALNNNGKIFLLLTTLPQALRSFCLIPITFLLVLTYVVLPVPTKWRKLFSFFLLQTNGHKWFLLPSSASTQLPVRSFYKWWEEILNSCDILVPQYLWNGCRSLWNGSGTNIYTYMYIYTYTCVCVCI